MVLVPTAAKHTKILALTSVSSSYFTLPFYDLLVYLPAPPDQKARPVPSSDHSPLSRWELLLNKRLLIGGFLTICEIIPNLAWALTSL